MVMDGLTLTALVIVVVLVVVVVAVVGWLVARRRLDGLPSGSDMEEMTDRLEPIAQAIERDGFAYARAPEMRAVLERAGLRDWDRFAASWDDLGVDAFMADGGRYRRRRFARFRG